MYFLLYSNDNTIIWLYDSPKHKINVKDLDSLIACAVIGIIGSKIPCVLSK